MSEKKLQNLAEKYPEYSGLFNAVLVWFRDHPKTNAVSIEHFYSNKIGYNYEDLRIAFMILKDNSVLNKFYRIFDENGSKIGSDYEDLNNIPKTVNDSDGYLKRTEEVQIVPYYSLNI